MGLTPVPQVLHNSRRSTKVDSPNTKQTRKPNKYLRSDILDDETVGPTPVSKVLHKSGSATKVDFPNTKPELKDVILYDATMGFTPI